MCNGYRNIRLTAGERTLAARALQNMLEEMAKEGKTGKSTLRGLSRLQRQMSKNENVCALTGEDMFKICAALEMLFNVYPCSKNAPAVALLQRLEMLCGYRRIGAQDTGRTLPRAVIPV